MIQATEVRKGHVIQWDNAAWMVASVQHITPGNWRAIIQIKMRNIVTGVQIEQRFSSSDRFEQPYMELVDMEYLYADGVQLIFMNQGNYEQIPLHKEVLGEDVQWLRENMSVKVKFCDSRVIGVELPASVDMKVAETEPGLKGATVTNVYKPAKLENGTTVQVPPFIEVGQTVRIDTHTGEYMERVSV